MTSKITTLNIYLGGKVTFGDVRCNVTWVMAHELNLFVQKKKDLCSMLCTCVCVCTSNIVY